MIFWDLAEKVKDYSFTWNDDVDYLGSRKLTPIEKFKSVSFKRDDQFQPLSSINGGKLRQTLLLLIKNIDVIKRKYNNTVITGCASKSPQSVVVAEACKALGIKLYIVFGVRNTENHFYLKYARDKLGAKIVLANAGYPNVIESRAKIISHNKKYFFIEFGVNRYDHADAIIGANMWQTQNLPKYIDELILPLGSGLTAAGVLLGLKKYDISVERIYGIRVGADPKPVIRNFRPDMEIIHETSPYPYNKRIKVDKPFQMDPTYEAKAWKWATKHLDLTLGVNVFWVVGNQRLYNPEMVK